MDSVRVSKRYATLENHSQDPLNPHPPFPQWAVHAVYPYQFWGSMQRRPVQQRYYMPTLENEFLRVTVAPDIGGRIWDVYDKIGKRHLANFNEGVRTYNAGFGLNYTAGGIECNYPLAHSCTTSRQREVSTQRHADGAASIVISEYERIWQTRWSVTYTLYPGRSYVELRVRIYNRTPLDSRYMYWNNCGFVLGDNTEFIFPEDAGAVHGEARKTFSWPIWRGQDISVFRNIPEPLGLYMLDAREPYFGYYDHDDEFGLVHYGDLADLPGKKYWSWGKRSDAAVRKTRHSTGEAFGEAQSGRIVIQEHLDRVPPETESEWTEIWFPVRGTGAFNSAGPGAAMRAEILETSSRRSNIRVVAMGNGSFDDAVVTVLSDDSQPTQQPLPLSAYECSESVISLPGPAGPDQNTTLLLRSGEGEILAKCRLRHPSPRDSWQEAVDYSQEVKATGVETFFRAAEAKARDWGNHELQPIYEKAATLDNDFSPARRELGKIAIWKGTYATAVEHLRAAFERDPDSLETRYFLGVALMQSGQTDEARKSFEIANRYDWECRSLVRLAELCMREQDWHHALKHLDRVAAAAPRLTRPRGLRAICLRKIGRRQDARNEIKQALAIDEQDPFLRIEQLFIRTRKLAGGQLPAAAVRRLIEQVRGHEPPLLEAAFDYLSVELYAEAQAVLDIIPDPGPLALMVRACTMDRLGDRAGSARVLRRACALDPTGHLPWRLAMIPILEWACERLPKSARPVFYLGNLLTARRRIAEGVALWRKAKSMGEAHYLLSANLGFYEHRVAKNPAAAAEEFRKAVQADPQDLYVKHELFTTLKASGQVDAALQYLEQERDAVLTGPSLIHDLLETYLENGEFAKFDALCAEPFDFSVNWSIPGPHSIWVKRHMQEALQLRRAGRLQAALEVLTNMGPPPHSFGMYEYLPDEDEQRLYHMGCIHDKLGNMKKARDCWQKAVSVWRFIAYEPAYWYGAWSSRYFQALALQKLGRHNEANTYLEGMEMLAVTTDLPVAARQAVLDLVKRGRYAPDDEKDPAILRAIEVATKAET